MTEPAHSRLFSPSAAHRWMRCTASPHAALRYDDEPGEAAMEGTAFHWLTETCLTEGSDPNTYLGRTLTVTQGQCRREFVVSPNMVTDARLIVDAVREIALRPGLSRVEARVSLAHLDPTMFGRCDIWHFGVDGVLSVFDTKYGRVDHSPVEHEQMMSYALAVYRGHVESRGPVSRVDLYIGQPRSLLPGPRIKMWSCDLDRLLNFELELRVAIHAVHNAPEFRMGPWCEYCPALGECPASRTEFLNLGPILAAADMTTEQAAKILRHKKMLESKIAAAAAVGKEALLHRQPVPGFKLVTGVRHRQYRDAEMAKEALFEACGLRAFEPVPPSQAEKLGADAAAVVSKLAFTPPGEPQIAPEDDRRAAYVPRSVEQIFGAPA